MPNSVLCFTFAENALFPGVGRSVPDQSFTQENSFVAFAKELKKKFERLTRDMNASDLVNTENHKNRTKQKRTLFCSFSDVIQIA